MGDNRKPRQLTDLEYVKVGQAIMNQLDGLSIQESFNILSGVVILLLDSASAKVPCACDKCKNPITRRANDIQLFVDMYLVPRSAVIASLGSEVPTIDVIITEDKKPHN